MDYTTFQHRGRPAWQAFAAMRDQATRSGLAALDHDELERMVELHRQVVSDFGYARARFAGTAVEARLRDLAFAGHQLLVSPRDR